MRVNLTASAELCRLAVLHFREQGGGRIVNVASRAAYRGDLPEHWHYAASKAGMVGDDQVDRARLCRREHPRLHRLPRLHHARRWPTIIWPAAAAQKILADIPLGRVATAEEVAETVRWLALDAPPRRPAR